MPTTYHQITTSAPGQRHSVRRSGPGGTAKAVVFAWSMKGGVNGQGGWHDPEVLRRRGEHRYRHRCMLDLRLAELRTNREL